MKLLLNKEGRASVSVEGVCRPTSWDNGMAQVAEFDVDGTGIIFQVRSWDPERQHRDLLPFFSKKIRITMEIVE